MTSGPCTFNQWSENSERVSPAQVLVTGENFGCGSSREHGVWATAAFGFRCVIAPSFGDIYRQNCFQNGAFPLVLPADEVVRITAELADESLLPAITIDLVEQKVVTPAGRTIKFDFDPERRQALLDRLDPEFRDVLAPLARPSAGRSVAGSGSRSSARRGGADALTLPAQARPFCRRLR